MPLQAAEWRRSKLKIFKPKKVKIENFELQKRYIPQNKAENIYNSVSAKKRKNFCKKKYFLKIFWFSWHARGPPEIFDVQFFEKFKKRSKKWLYWDLSNIERNKVMNFGEPSPNPMEMADHFWSSGHNVPTLRWNRVKHGHVQTERPLFYQIFVLYGVLDWGFDFLLEVSGSISGYYSSVNLSFSPI